MPGLYPWLLGGNEVESLANTTVSTNCSDGVRWLYVVLGDCVTDAQGYASDICGVVSLLLWMTVATPQMVSNCRRIEGMAGVSILLIAQWTLGDTTNLIGAILTKQLPLQIYLAIYFVFADFILICQYIWYQTYLRRQKKKEKQEAPRVVLCFAVGFLVMNGYLQSYLPSSRPAVHHPAGRNLLHIEIFHNIKDELGYAIGVVSSLFYIGSRVAQLVKNYKRQSTDGLSLMMFLLAILGNITYGLSILVRSIEVAWVLQHLPWLVGSLGVVLLDISLVVQFKLYGASEFERLTNEKMTDDEIIVDPSGVRNYGVNGSINSPDDYGSINNPDRV